MVSARDDGDVPGDVSVGVGRTIRMKHAQTAHVGRGRSLACSEWREGGGRGVKSPTDEQHETWRLKACTSREQGTLSLQKYKCIRLFAHLARASPIHHQSTSYVD